MKILLSFGSEDAAGLTRILLDAIIEYEKGRGKSITGPEARPEITICLGPLYDRAGSPHESWPETVKVVKAPADMPALLAEQDLVVTHFGLTAYEASALGVSVILFNPTGFHRLLSRRAGFPEIGVKKPDTRRLARLLDSPDTLRSCHAASRKRMESLRGASLQEVIAGLDPVGLPCCPACLSENTLAVARFPDRTYFRCKSCSLFSMMDFTGGRKAYTREYFFEEYRKQYGRTYLEDFDQIKAMGMERLREIRRITGALKGIRLLDVGCAFGPFLAAAKETGFIPEGMDINPDAISWVRENLKIKAFAGDFPSYDWKTGEAGGPYDVLTMWYVIEHFTDVKRVLEQANRLLPVGGVFAFSTPNAAGISGRKNLRLFFQASPADHFSIWSVKSAKRCLASAGFSVRGIRVTGVHPERFFRRREKAPDRKTLGYRILELVSGIAGLGDTFEVYAVKKRNL